VRLVGGIAARIASAELPLIRVKRVVAGAVIDVLRNPEGFQSQSESVGPYSTSFTRFSRVLSGAAASGPTRTSATVRFTEDELDSLRPDAGPPARTIALALPAWQTPRC